MTDEPAPTIAALVRDRLDTFSPAERRVARTLLADYPSASLSTASDLARAAGSSAPSVVRFANRLGLDGFTALQERLRAELTTRRTSPVSRVSQVARVPEEGTAAELVRDGARFRRQLIETTLAGLPPSEIEAAVEALTDSRHRVLLTGGYFSAFVAQYFALYLNQMRPSVTFAAEPLHRDLGLVLELGKRDTLVIFDFRRYELSARDLAVLAREQGCRIVLVTDVWLSPASAYADVVLPMAVGGVTFDSFTAVVCCMEAFLAPIAKRLGADAVARMERWEGIDNPTRRGLEDYAGPTTDRPATEQRSAAPDGTEPDAATPSPRRARRGE